MARIPRSILLALLCGTLAAATTSANSCNIDGDDQTLYMQVGESWIKYESSAQLNGETGPRSFAYIVKSRFGADRTGAVVIKSGDNVVTPGKGDTERKVRIVRLPGSTDVCSRTNWRATTRHVSQDAYEAYHDKASPNDSAVSETERQNLDRFHLNYRSAPLNKCVSTNDVDHYTPSNLSQFSFSPYVVRRGTIGVLEGGLWTLANYIFTPAYGSAKGVNLRTEIKHYRTNSGSACIPFSIRSFGPNSFLAVNDLEARYIGRTREVRR